jgi:branched-chain amino acid aminotransferase
MGKIFLNSKLVDSHHANLSIFDRGFLYGDGVFESLRTYFGKPFLLEEHLKRLFKSAAELKFNVRSFPRLAGGSRTQLYKYRIGTIFNIKKNIYKLLKANCLKEAYLKIILTRGEAKRHGLSIKNAAGKPTLIIIAEKIVPAAKPRCAKIITLAARRGTLAKIKSLNYLESILAKSRAETAGADEAVFIDEQSYVLEGTVSNIFIIKNNVLFTPPLSLPILPGVTRQLIINLARRLKIKTWEKKIKLKDLLAADGCFLTNSGDGILPVIKINRKKLAVGPITKRLQGQYFAIINQTCNTPQSLKY